MMNWAGVWRVCVCVALTGALYGCVPKPAQKAADHSETELAQVNWNAGLAKVVRTDYNYLERTVTLHVAPICESARLDAWVGEQVLDLNRPAGAVNYALSHYAKNMVGKVVVLNADMAFPSAPFKRLTTVVPKSMRHVIPADNSAVGPVASLAAVAPVPVPAPGTALDPSIKPLAPQGASEGQKVRAVITVAKSKLGTPYIWGHNEDRGQFGFDCSNYTAYVYHHALGYAMPGISKDQYLNVGVRVPVNNMKAGDLLVFDDGAHVGIYIGNGRMIQAGGGLARVGYLSIGSGSYWGRRITTVKRII